MAVDKYINTESKFLDNQNNEGAMVLRSIVSFPILQADGINSVFRVFKNINVNNRISKIIVMTDGITDLTDTDLGYYNINSGAVVDIDALMDGQTLAVASRDLDGMSAVAITKIGKRHYEVAGKTAENKGVQLYDIALTLKAAPGADGNVTVIMDQETF